MSEITKQLSALKEKIERAKKLNWMEENTKMALISKVLQILGYDITEPDEVSWESSIGIAGNNGEKVDFAVYLDRDKPEFIIEAKAVNTNLNNDKLWNQLFTYFNAIQPRIAILTNGDDWWFYTDKVDKHLLDREPYLRLSISESKKEDLQKFEDYHKDKIRTLDVSKQVLAQSFQAAKEELFCMLKMGYFPGYFLEAFISKYGLDDLDKNLICEELEYQLKTDLLEGSKKVTTNELSKVYEARSTKFESMVSLQKLYEKNDMNLLHEALREVYIQDRYTKVSSWEDLFVKFVLMACERSYDNLELICDLDIWTSGLFVKKGKTESGIYYSEYDISIQTSSDKRLTIRKLLKMIENLGMGGSVISFDIELADEVVV